MIAESLLVVALRAEAILLFVATLLLFGHALWLRLRRLWAAPRLAMARLALNRAIDADRPADDDLALLRALPMSLRIRVVTELSRSIAGTQRNRLDRVAAGLGITAFAARLCRSRLWWNRLRGARLFTAVRAGDDVMPALLHDRNAAVRTQATEWAATCPHAEVISELLVMLDDPSRLCRFTVRDSLLRVGPAMCGLLEQYLARSSGASAEAALEVAAGRAEPRFLPAALRLTRDDRPATRRQAAALLSAIGGPTAIARLVELLDDDDATVRAEAAHGLGRMGHWPAAPQLAPRLRDAAWIVRREAGLALRALGAPGALYLRRYVGDADRFAADMARQVLDLPAVPGASTGRRA
jgi:hypothetical protein